MKLYISGGISGVPDYKERFNQAHAKLMKAGYEIENPATYNFCEDVPWVLAMKYDLARMLECDGVAYLDNWQYSRGAVYEVGIATDMEMKIHSVDEWVEIMQNIKKPL